MLKNFDANEKRLKILIKIFKKQKKEFTIRKLF